MGSILNIAAIGAVSLLLAAFATLGVMNMLDPVTASTRFGLPVQDETSTYFYRVYLSRNLGIVLAGFGLLFTRQWKALAILVTAVIALPVFDIVTLQQGGHAVPPVHPITVGVLVLVSALLWLKVRRDSAG